MRSIALIGISLALLAGCTGHQYEPREPGVSVSGTAGIGIKYADGKTTPVNETKLSIQVGGSL